MTITQTVEIPADRRLTIEVPKEVPAGMAVLTFTTPATDIVNDCPECARRHDPVTGEPRFNAQTIAAIEEGDAMLRGEKPAKWHTSLDDLDKMLGL